MTGPPVRPGLLPPFFGRPGAGCGHKKSPGTSKGGGWNDGDSSVLVI
jgi:hypothetical protein